MISAWWLLPAVWGGALFGILTMALCQIAAADRFIRDIDQ